MNELATITDIRESFGRLKGCILRDDLKEVRVLADNNFGMCRELPPVQVIEASIFIEVVDDKTFHTKETHEFLGTVLPQLGYMVIHQMSGRSYSKHLKRPNTIIEIKRSEKRLV